MAMEIYKQTFRRNKSKTLVVREVWRERAEGTKGKKMRLILKQ
jgi:hypothetical protein